MKITFHAADSRNPAILTLRGHPAAGDYHVGRAHFRRRGPSFDPHTHADFAEVAWVLDGRGMHHVNGRRVPIRQGHLVAIRRTDVHAFRPIDDMGFSVMNVALRAGTLDFLRKRYFPDGRDWPWREADELPAVYDLRPEQVMHLTAAAESLPADGSSRLRLDAFLLDVLVMLSPAKPSVAENLPEWLRSNLDEFRKPETLALGPRELARRCNRSLAHVSRTLRAATGQTATHYINGLRLDLAAQLLLTTPMPIVEVAEECGLGNLGYFYRLFRKRFGVTPRRFRLQRESRRCAG